MRTCTKCGESKSKTDFYKDSKSKDGFKFWCKVCSNSATKEWENKNKEKRREIKKRWRQNNRSLSKKIHRNSALKFKYGITQTEYEEILSHQGGVCACCSRFPDNKRNLGVDHDHSSGEIRGLLCDHCNVGIGRLGDCEEGVFAALAYLKRAKQMDCLKRINKRLKSKS